MNKAKVIRIDGNKLLGAKSKEEVIKSVLEQIKAQDYDCNCENCNECDSEENNTKGPEEFIKLLAALTALKEATEEIDELDDCPCCCDDEDDCLCCYDEDEEDESLPEDLFDFLDHISTMIDEQEKNEKESVMKNNAIRNNARKDSNRNSYTFTEMIEEFSNGYDGTFTDGCDVYRFIEGTLLYETEVGTFPVILSGELLRSEFYKKQILINGPKALELAIEGNMPNFTVDLYGRTYTGHLSMKNGIPSYKIDGDVIGNPETIVLGALMTGKWHL